MPASRSLCRLPRTHAAIPRCRSVRHVPLLTINSFTPPCQQQKARIASRRLYSTQDEATKPTRPIDDILEEDIDHVDLNLEEQMLAIQDAAIAELEERLGKSLEDAIEQDGAAERLIGSWRLPEDIAQERAVDQAILEATESPLALLRAGSSTPTEVAREARDVFGDYLPEDALTAEELVIYKRMYGEPLAEEDRQDERYYIDGEDVDIDTDEVPENILLDEAGEAVPYRFESAKEIEDRIASKGEAAEAAVSSNRLKSQEATDTREAQLSDNEIFEVIQAVGGEVLDEGEYAEEQEDLEESSDTRTHAMTKLGRFATSPRTTFLPKESFVEPIEKILGGYSNKHLQQMCLNTFGGVGLPDSPLTPRILKARQQLPIPLEASQQSMSQMEANAFLTAVMPPTYASIQATLVETRKRLGSSWLNKLLARPDGPRVLDVGAGGAGIAAWKEVVDAHWASLHSSDKKPPPTPESKSVVLTASDALRHRAVSMLENTTFIPRLPDYVHARQGPNIEDDRPAPQRKQFDVIIASHSIFPLKEEWQRKQHVQNLWSLLSDEGGVLILIEKGIPRGFEVIAAAREMLLERYIEVPEGHENYYSEDRDTTTTDDVHKRSPGMILAPCTNQGKCPLYRTPGVSSGRKDICSFQQRYIRPPFLQRVLGAKDRNHDDVDFSYISVMKGDDLRNRSFSTFEHVNDPLSAPSAAQSELLANAGQQKEFADSIQAGFEHVDPTWEDTPIPPPSHLLPRMINDPLKRQGHVTMDLCTPQGEIRRWTVPKSFSRQAYRDARKSRWGDLWALGAKTSVLRNLKLGTSRKEMAKSEGMKAPKPRSRKERLRMQAELRGETQDAMDEEDLEEAQFQKLLEEDNLLDEDDDFEDDEDDGLIDMDTLLPKKSSKQKQQSQQRRNSPTATTTSSSRNPTQHSPNSRAKQRHSVDKTGPLDRDTIRTLDYTPGRYGEENNNLADWAEEIENIELDDEARRFAVKSGLRPTARNTRRAKRDLRRARDGR